MSKTVSFYPKKKLEDCPVGSILKHTTYDDTWVVKIDSNRCITLGPCKSRWAENGRIVRNLTLSWLWYVVWEPEYDK